ncbi:MAG: MATE family efflux transporter [Clostridia bacterium]|nr:MATE family efflux transporter [Clostridia bacterium]
MKDHGDTVLLTEGNPKKMMLSFAFPVFLSQLFQQLYNTADAWIVGHYLGDRAFAAVASSGSLVFLFISFFIGLSMGAGVVISRFFGAGDRENVSRAVHTNVLMSLLCGILLGTVGVLLTPSILRLMKTDPDVLPLSISYFRYFFIGAPAMVMYNSLKGVMNAVGDSRRPLYYLMFSSALNIFLDWLFVGPCGFDIRWAAIATAISQTASALLCLKQLRKKGTVYRLSLRRLRIHGAILKDILRLGIPSGVQNSVIGLANVLVQTNINTFGDTAMAACGAYSRIEGFAFLPITSFSMAITTFISQNLGAKQYERTRKGARFGILTSVSMAEMIGLTIFVFARPMISAFVDEPESIQIGILQCRIESLFFCLLAFSHCIAAVCRGAGKAFIPMFVMLSVWCVLRVTVITVAMHFSHSIILLFWVYPLTWFISSVIYLMYYLFSDWIHGFEKKQSDN